MLKKTISAAVITILASCSAQNTNIKPSSAPVNQEADKKEAVMEKTIMTWADLKSRPLPEPSLTLNYSDLPTGIIDVWLPDGAGPHPVVLMVHGGCWQKSIADRSLMNYAADDLRKQGLAVWNIEYRGVDEPGGGYPGTFEDVAQAGNALSQHASQLNLDLKRVAGFGHSAGGHLITWYAGSPNLPTISRIASKRDIELRGVINSGGLADLAVSEPVTIPSCLAEIRPRLTGLASETRPDPYADTSSDRILPSGVPIYSVNGGLDKIAPGALGENFTKKVANAGDVGIFKNIEGEGHVELIAPGSKAFNRQAQVLKELLALK